MANYVVSGRQLLATIVASSVFVTVSATAAVTLINYRELPEVHVDLEGKCNSVVNFKNGDGFVCQDRDVTLRKYRVVPPEVKQ